MSRDAATLDFRRDYFHHVTCSFGLFFLRDMAAALKEWVRVIAPGGSVMFTAFGPLAFEPMRRQLRERLQSEGVDMASAVQVASRQLADADFCRTLLSNAGLTPVTVEIEQLGYHLQQRGQLVGDCLGQRLPRVGGADRTRAARGIPRGAPSGACAVDDGQGIMARCRDDFCSGYQA